MSDLKKETIKRLLLMDQYIHEKGMHGEKPFMCKGQFYDTKQKF